MCKFKTRLLLFCSIFISSHLFSNINVLNIGSERNIKGNSNALLATAKLPIPLSQSDIRKAWQTTASFNRAKLQVRQHIYDIKLAAITTSRKTKVNLSNHINIKELNET